MTTTINSTRNNSPSFGMAADARKIIALTKEMETPKVNRILEKITKIHALSDDLFCNVDFRIEEEGSRRSRDLIQHVVAEVTSQEDGAIKGNKIYIDPEKFGNKFSTFFGKIRRSITEVRFKQEDINDLSGYTTAQISPDVVDLAKGKPSSVVARLNKEVGKIDNFADELGCNVDIGLRQSSRNSRRNAQHVVAKVSSQNDPDIRSNGTYINQEKFGNRFTGFFRRINKNIQDISIKEESINELSKFQ